MSLHIQSDSFLISSDKRLVEVQELIDQSFKIRTLPLHEFLFKGESDNYAYVGIERDYVFYGEAVILTKISALKKPAILIKASKIAEEFAAKEKFAVLDLGCGVGGFLEGLKERFSNVEVMGMTAADFRPTRYNSTNLTISDEEYIVGNLENLIEHPAMLGKKFDLIVSHMTFRHLSDPLSVICQAYELLSENGILLVDYFQLNGISADEQYPEIFKQAGCEHVELVIYWDSAATQTKIRKVALEHLRLPIAYDLDKSTKADENNQAHIFYRKCCQVHSKSDS